MRDLTRALIEHSNWANARLCEALAERPREVLDRAPVAGSTWSIRKIVAHIAQSQQGYLSLLTNGREPRSAEPSSLESATDLLASSGEKLLSVVDPESFFDGDAELHSSDGYSIEAWIVVVQAVNHATDHRRQIQNMLRELGEPAPRLDGWGYGEELGVVRPPTS